MSVLIVDKYFFLLSLLLQVVAKIFFKEALASTHFVYYIWNKLKYTNPDQVYQWGGNTDINQLLDLQEAEEAKKTSSHHGFRKKT